MELSVSGNVRATDPVYRSRIAPFSCEYRIYYEDTDASGVVYHANYLKLFERARTEFLRRAGFGQETLRAEQKAVFTIANIQVAFRAPARLDDLVSVSVQPQRVRHASLEFVQYMHRQADETLLASASVKAGCVRYPDFRPCPMPGVVRQALLSISEQ